MNDHYKWLAEHLLKQLNKLGIVKDAQVNSTTVLFVAGQVNEYMTSQKLTLEDKPR